MRAKQYDTTLCVCLCVIAAGESVTKERAAETGQEGLEEVPDNQDTLRKHASVSKENRSTEQDVNNSLLAGNDGEVAVDNEEKGVGEEDKSIGEGSSHSHSGKTDVKSSPSRLVSENHSSPGGKTKPADNTNRFTNTEEDEDDEGRLKSSRDKKQQHKQQLHMEHHRPRGPPAHPHLSPHHLPPSGAMMGGPANGYPPPMPYPYPPPPGHYPPHLYPPPPGEDMRNGTFHSTHLSYYPPPPPSSSSPYRYPSSYSSG